MNKIILIIVVIAAAGLGGYFLLNSNSQPEVSGTPSSSPTQSTGFETPTPSISVTGSPSASSSPTTSPSKTPTTSPTPTPIAQVKVFNVDGVKFSFSVKEMRVKKGDTVKIVFNNKDGMHDWVVDEFSARTPVIQAGQTATVIFVADKTGTFEYYCSVGSHRANGMKGNLIVE